MEKLTWHTEQRIVDELLPHAENPRQISPAQKQELIDSIERLGFAEIPAINTDNKIVAGHQRLAVLKLLNRGQETIDVRVPDRKLTQAEFDEYLIRSNKNTGSWDWTKLFGYDKEMLLSIGFGVAEIKKMMKFQDREGNARLTLAERFIIPPFSVLDARSKVWQDRKHAWLELCGDLAATRESVLYADYTAKDANFYVKKSQIEEFLGREITLDEYREKYYEPDVINGGVSIFDPALTEIIYTWFNPKGGKILDPFAGDQAKGIVAGEMKLQYVGVDVRADQVAIDNEACAKYPGVKFIAADSNEIDKAVQESDFDLLFTCPPYYDLEVYSKEDMSALGTYEEFMQQYRNIFKKSIAKLKDNSFVVLVVGEVRNKKTGEFMNFVGDTIQAMKDLGLVYYNELILVTCTGSLAMRTPGQFNKSRKAGKTHQNVLAFYKGQAETLYRESKAIYAAHQNVLTFFKGSTAAIGEKFGEVARITDII